MGIGSGSVLLGDLDVRLPLSTEPPPPPWIIPLLLIFLALRLAIICASAFIVLQFIAFGCGNVVAVNGDLDTNTFDVATRDSIAFIGGFARDLLDATRAASA